MQTTDVREGARQAVEGAGTLITRQVETGTHLLGERIGTVVGELRTVSEHLTNAGPAAVAAPYVTSGVDIVERFGQYLKDADTERLVADLEQMARRQPWFVAAGALVIGFAASRFLKTSSARRYYGTVDTGYGDDDDFGFDTRSGGTEGGAYAT